MKALKAGWTLAIAILGTPPALAEQGTAVEYFNASMGHYFVTAFPEEAAAIDAGKIAGWQRTGHSFPVELAPVAGSQSVCRFFTMNFAPKSSHFYTPNPGECESLKSNPVWQYEAVAFHLMLPDAAGSCPAGTSAIYRFYNNGTTGAPNHRYTADPLVVKAMKAQGWTQEGNGATGIFACGPSVPVTNSSLSVRIDFNPGVRFLNTADGAALTAQTPTVLTFSRDIPLGVGELFVLPEIGAWRAVSVQRNGVQTIVNVETASINDLFADLEIDGTIDLADAPEIASAPAPARVQPLAKALLETETETTFVQTINAAGDKGRKLTVTVQAACGPNPKSKMRLLEFTGEVYGLPKVRFSLKDPKSASAGPFAYKVTGGVYIGCKISLPAGQIKLLDRPIPQALGLARIQVFARARLETNIAPVLQVFQAEYEGVYPTGAQPAALRTTNPGLVAQLLEGSAIGTTFNATALGEIDVALKVIEPLTNTYLVGAGVKGGPAVDLNATAVAKLDGSAGVDLCAQLKWPAELYTDYHDGKALQHKAWVQTEYPLPSPDDWKTCKAGSEPSGNWRFTTKSCVQDPGCTIKCNDTIDFTLSANADKSRIEQFFPVDSNKLYLTLQPQAGAPKLYVGNTSEGGVVQVQTMQFASDWKSATWNATQIFPADSGFCTVQQSGDAVLTKPRP